MAKKAINDGEATISARARALRVSPQKLSLIVDTIRGVPVGDALARLEFSRRRIAGEVGKVLSSAIANAENNANMNADNLYVRAVYVGQGMRMKRFRPRAKGRSGRILKPFSRLTIVVAEQARS